MTTPRPAGPSDGRTRTSIQEVAERAGVAVSSVSRVVSGHPDVSEAMRARVAAAVAELGFQPDFVAQSLRRGATLSVGFVAGDITNPLIASIAYGAESTLRAAGYSMTLMNSGRDPSLDEAHIRFFAGRRVDGMLLSLSSDRRRATVDLLAGLNVPVVVIDRDVPSRAGASSVLSDHRAGMAAATNHLLSRGIRRIGLINGPLDIRAPRERLKGLQQAVDQSDTSAVVISDDGPFSTERADAAAMRFLDMDDPPTALVAAGNQLIIGALRALRRRELTPGHDIALITCDDIPLAELLQPPLDVIARDSVELGRTAADLLLRRLRGKEPPTTVTLPTTFLHRGSS